MNDRNVSVTKMSQRKKKQFQRNKSLNTNSNKLCR